MLTTYTGYMKVERARAMEREASRYEQDFSLPAETIKLIAGAKAARIAILGAVVAFVAAAVIEAIG